MPGEISRSYKGPIGRKPLLPPWLCPLCELPINDSQRSICEKCAKEIERQDRLKQIRQL